jgi:hypothetical protein
MALGSIPWPVGLLFAKALDWPRTFVGRRCVGIIVWRRSHRHWMQGRNRKEGNCFLNRNIRRLE